MYLWHFVFLAFFIFSIIRFIYWIGENNRRKSWYSTTQRNLKLMPRYNQNDLVDVSGELRGETERAFRFYDGKETCWLPKSQCEWDETSGTMTLPHWLALEKGLI